MKLSSLLFVVVVVATGSTFIVCASETLDALGRGATSLSLLLFGESYVVIDDVAVLVQ